MTAFLTRDIYNNSKTIVWLIAINMFKIVNKKYISSFVLGHNLHTATTWNDGL